MEAYFSRYRERIIGIQSEIETPFGERKPVVYADWAASGRCYAPIEDRIKKEVMPFVANTHTKSSGTGRIMTQLYEEAKKR